MTLLSASLDDRRRQRIAKAIGISAALVLGVSAGFGTAKPVAAAEQFVLTYGPFARSISISDLQTLADTGVAPSSLQPYLRLARISPEALRTVLTRDLGVSLRFLDRSLNSLPGEFALFHLGKLIHSPERVANIQALRSAFVLSAAPDNRLTLLEFLENYPTRSVYLDGVRLASVARQVSRVVGDVRARLEPIIEGAKEFLGGFICDCEGDNQSSLIPAEDQQAMTTGFAETDAFLKALSCPSSLPETLP
ncbi:alpha/beta hydrolase [Pantanalinema rosaneae CENA516]|uniref:alpha/beta hydrolase n=1 Tax=Pantanalinema rosaneae TaxID=1620701 RepID=UPI003D6F6AB5